MERVLTLILGGGRGTRLFPLTKNRSKPAVPIGGKYRIIDVPVSNCIRAYLKKIYVITQFNSKSLNHHINHTYRFDNFENAFVDILAAQQTETSENWYRGTADAVRSNLPYIKDHTETKHVLILSGDQLYRMNFGELLKVHERQDADMTLASYPVSRSQVPGLGVMKVVRKDSYFQISDFAEKPQEASVVDDFAFDFNAFPLEQDSKNKDVSHLASMGIYLFKKEVLIDLLESSDAQDFGHHVVPHLIRNGKVVPYFFSGYWEDIGTIRSFHQANLDLVGSDPEFNLYEQGKLLLTNCRYLPPAHLGESQITNCLVSEGAFVKGGTFSSSLIGLRSQIEKDVVFDKVVMLGADYYEKEGVVPSIGKGCVMHNTIIDKNVRIGNNCRFVNEQNLQTYDDDKNNIYIRDGIIVIAKDSVIPDNFVL